MIRSFVCSKDFNGHAVGFDQSGSFINAAKSFARNEHLDDRLQFQIGDAHDLDFPSASFDTVIANTLISHVSDPARVLEEMAWVLIIGAIGYILDSSCVMLIKRFSWHRGDQ